LVLFQYPVQYPKARSVFNVLRAPPLREVRYWLPDQIGPSALVFAYEQAR